MGVKSIKWGALLAAMTLGGAAWWGAFPLASHASPQADRTIAELEATAATLRRRITRLQDEEQVETLVSVYGYYLDKQQWDQLTDLFADDGSMEISLRGVYHGKQSIRRALELFGPQNIEPAHLHNHIQLQPVVQISEDGMHGFSRS